MPKKTCKRLSLKWDEEAEEEWEQILTYYTLRNASHAYSLKLDKELQETLAAICERPGMGQEMELEGVRRFSVVRRFAVFYQFDSEKVEVLSVVDARRNVPLD